MKLTKLHLFIIIMVVLVLSTLGFSIKEYLTNMDNNDSSIQDGDSYDPFNNGNATNSKNTADGTHDPLNDNDYSKTIAGLEDIVVPGRGSGKHHHDKHGNHYPGAHGIGKKEERKMEKKMEKKIERIEDGKIDMSKYILKSEIVPPVCPKCPDSRTCPREEPCPACPPCARCPEPAFECKKVPNYSAISAASASGILPMPRLNSFSQFN